MLKDKVCIVTGASGGIGEALVRTLASCKVKLVLAARRVKKLRQIRNSLPKGVDALCVECDVTSQEALQSLTGRTLKEYGKIDILVNGAGVSSQYPFWEQPLEDISNVMNTNYYSYVMLSRLVVGSMKKNKGGHIVNITSGSVMVDPPPRNFIVYTSLKVALRSFAKGLFWEMRDYGIKVTSIFPGVTRTPLTGKLKEVSSEGSRLMDPEAVAETVLFALKQPANVCPLELAVINQRTPWKKPVIPFSQKHPEK